MLKASNHMFLKCFYGNTIKVFSRLPKYCIELFIYFLDKPYQEINFKSHLNSVLLCK